LPFGEEPLCRVGGIESEVYRFVWHSSFHGDATVQIVREGDAINLLWKYWSYSLPAADASAPLMTLSTVDWDQLQRRLDVASFWSLDPDSSDMGLDGASWLIEGRRKDAYHSIYRWSPSGPLFDLGRLFFDLAGRPLAEVELY